MMTPSGKITGEVFSAAVWTAKPGKEEAFLKRWKDFAQWSFDHQKGSISVVMVRDINYPNVFISIGPWADLESIQNWRQSPEFAAAFQDFKDLCDKIEPHTIQRVFTIDKNTGK
jgi:quinol monooxygenase YgiN